MSCPRCPIHKIHRRAFWHILLVYPGFHDAYSNPRVEAAQLAIDVLSLGTCPD